MKKIFQLIITIASISGLMACHDLDVPVTTQLTPDIFPQTPTQFIQAAGPTYNAFRQNYSTDYWFLQSLSTDEAILPARGGNWYDGGRYEQHHKHTWNQDNPHVQSAWSWLTSTISTSNQNIFLISKAPESPAKQTSLAELRTMRAMCYFMMMDMWGNIPISTKFGDTTTARTTARADVFKFIEKELQESIPNLSTVVGQETYGRPNKYTAYTILAKMYLNAEVYTGTARWNDAIIACDNVISSGKYAIESDYRKMFFVNNGPQIKEFIFAIPYDASAPNGYMFYARYSLPRSLRAKYSLPFTPSSAASTLPEFYAYFNDAKDVRNQQWITGKQFDYKGNPVMVSTTKQGYDEDYKGADAGTSLSYQVDITPDVIIKKPATFDLGNDEKAWNMGYRNNKFYADSTSATRNQNNDVPIFRYADVLLMKAEAIARGGSATNGQTAISLVNEVRSKRTTSAAWTSVTLQQLYEERAREFTWETWHRNDMIRFGKYEDTWGAKTDKDVKKRLFPIPTNALQLNRSLTQNPGY